MGVSQGDGDETKIRAALTDFITPTVGLSIEADHDVAVRNGFSQNIYTLVRILKVF